VSYHVPCEGLEESKEWIRLRKVGFEPTNLSRSETTRALFMYISWKFRDLKLGHVCSEGSGSTPRNKEYHSITDAWDVHSFNIDVVKGHLR
jgi:hypothetical protein